MDGGTPTRTTLGSNHNIFGPTYTTVALVHLAAVPCIIAAAVIWDAFALPVGYLTICTIRPILCSEGPEGIAIFLIAIIGVNIVYWPVLLCLVWAHFTRLRVQHYRSATFALEHSAPTIAPALLWHMWRFSGIPLGLGYLVCLALRMEGDTVFSFGVLAGAGALGLVLVSTSVFCMLGFVARVWGDTWACMAYAVFTGPWLWIRGRVVELEVRSAIPSM